MARVLGDRAHGVEVEGLTVEDVVGQALAQHLDQVAGRAAAHEAGACTPPSRIISARKATKASAMPPAPAWNEKPSRMIPASRMKRATSSAISRRSGLV